MRVTWPATLVLGLLAGTAGAEEAARSARTSASPAPKRLNLGPYRSVYADDPAQLAAQLRFQEQVEVRGRAMDRAALTAKLEWWMRDYDLTRGATPATLSAPSLQEIREYRPHPPDSVNLMPVMQWLTEKLSGRTKK